MRDWLRKRLDAWEGRQARRDEEFAALLNRNIDALADRRTRLIYLGILAVLNAFIWLAVIIFPRDIREAWATVNSLDERIGSVIIAIIFGLGMWFTYTLFRLRFYDLENPRFEQEMFVSYSYALHATKR
ncbi:MAG TPA: hypothetical protein VEV84_12820 [Pyrinomonadaceae bacterium]|nr:hypothetical protein [Pyrinomonadaceae bacterium]